jgi:flagellin-like hook-associated protein FlgL
MKVTPTFLIASFARADISRITGDLYDLQRQTASGYLADDLKGYGDNAGRIINARSVIAQTDARKAGLQRLQTRLDLQDAALEKASQATAQLKQEIIEAIATDNGTFLAGRLETAFSQVRAAMNQSYDGVTLFAGERRGQAAIRLASLSDISTNITDAQMFNESERPEQIHLGIGALFEVSEMASDISRDFFNAARDLYNALQSPGFGSPLTAAERDQLTGVAESFETARKTIVEAQGRNGDANARIGREIERFEAQSTLIENHMDQIASADLAEVSMKLAATQTQYQAIAKVFSDIRNLTLVNFLD